MPDTMKIVMNKFYVSFIDRLTFIFDHEYHYCIPVKRREVRNMAAKTAACHGV